MAQIGVIGEQVSADEPTPGPRAVLWLLLAVLLSVVVTAAMTWPVLQSRAQTEAGGAP